MAETINNQSSTNTARRPVVLVVGCGFGGLAAVRALRNSPVQVIVIDRQNHYLFQPLLYQVATADLSPADIAAPIRGILHNQKNAEVILDEVTGIDTESSSVQLSDRQIQYDFLILAMGARHSSFGRDDWEAHAPGLKSISDATSIRRKILLAFERAEMERDDVVRKSLLTFVIVGGGPTGVEMAGTIASLARTTLRNNFRHIDPAKSRIILIEASPRILAAFSESLSQKAQVELISSGVEVRSHTRVTEINADGVQIGEEYIPAHTIIWAAGVIASPAGTWLKTEVDHAGRVLVQPNLTVPNHPNIFVIGDSAHLEIDGKQLPGIAPVAMQQGRYVGKYVRDIITGKHVSSFKYKDKGSLATVGRMFAIAEFGNMRLSGLPAWLLWVTVHIFYLMGFRNRAAVALNWIVAYITRDRGARLIVDGEPGHKR